MNKKEWKKIIEDQIKFDHDNIPSFQTTIQILSEMLEERDRVYSMYIESGAQPVVNFTSDRGAINLKQNPLLRTWQEINTLCLSYLRDLGLTAAGLRKLQGQLPKDNGGQSALDLWRERLGVKPITNTKLIFDPAPPAKKAGTGATKRKATATAAKPEKITSKKKTTAKTTRTKTSGTK